MRVPHHHHLDHIPGPNSGFAQRPAASSFSDFMTTSCSVPQCEASPWHSPAGDDVLAYATADSGARGRPGAPGPGRGDSRRSWCTDVEGQPQLGARPRSKATPHHPAPRPAPASAAGPPPRAAAPLQGPRCRTGGRAGQDHSLQGLATPRVRPGTRVPGRADRPAPAVGSTEHSSSPPVPAALPTGLRQHPHPAVSQRPAWQPIEGRRPTAAAQGLSLVRGRGRELPGDRLDAAAAAGTGRRRGW